MPANNTKNTPNTEKKIGNGIISREADWTGFDFSKPPIVPVTVRRGGGKTGGTYIEYRRMWKNADGTDHPRVSNIHSPEFEARKNKVYRIYVSEMFGAGTTDYKVILIGAARYTEFREKFGQELPEVSIPASGKQISFSRFTSRENEPETGSYPVTVRFIE